jgi:tRNA uridine 5-carboxymethylaminomethyl modification enzyme
MVREKAPWCPRRDEAYVGVLIDDLITRGTLEPYRMFTSRAEYRLLLREDNADLRLTAKGRELGLVDDAHWRVFEEKREAIAREQQRLHDTWVRPGQIGDEDAARLLGAPLAREYRAMELLRRPGVSYVSLMTLPGVGPACADPKVAEQVEIQARYAGYIDRQQDEIERHRRHEETCVPRDFDYSRVRGLSAEVREKLTRVRPATLGQAARIAGVTPAAVSLLLVHLKKRAGNTRQSA